MRIIAAILIAFSSFYANGQNTTDSSYLSRLRPIYDKAKAEFSAYENKHGRFIQTPNVNMHYLVWGNPDDTPLIWCHGSLTNGYEIKKVAGELVKKGLFVIAIDYYGHGQTAIPSHEVSLYHVADDIKHLMNHLKIKKAVVGGFSRGGYIATAFYDSHPESVMAIILEDGGSVSFNNHYHRLSNQDLNKTIISITSSFNSIAQFNTEFDAFASIYDADAGGSQFENLSWIRQNKDRKWVIGEGLLDLFGMQDSESFSNLILRPTKAPLFGQSMASMEPKIIYRNLSAPLLILDPVKNNDAFPFEKENEALANKHSGLVKHVIYKETDHNIHYSHPGKFVKDIVLFLSQYYIIKNKN